MDLARISSEWMRALRGKRKQLTLGRRLGYESNIVYRWEAGACYPSAATFFRFAALCGRDPRAALRAFLRDNPPWLDNCPLDNTEGVASFVSALRGVTAIGDLARLAGHSRYQVSRWLAGKTQPTLPEFLSLVHACTGRLLDLIHAFVDPATLPSVRADWQKLCSSREIAYSMPWSHAVLKVLTLKEYRKQPHSDAWVAAQLGMDVSLVGETLAALRDTGQVAWDGRHYVEFSPDVVDTRNNPERARQLKSWWTRTALQRLEANAPGVFAYNLSAVSKEDLKRIEQLWRQTYREMSRIIAESKDPECVVLYAAQLTSLERDVSQSAQ